MLKRLMNYCGLLRTTAFIPHNLQGEGPEPPPPIQIGYQEEPRGFNDIINQYS